MAEVTKGVLRTLAVEIRTELALLDRSVSELGGIAGERGDPATNRVRLYATAALLDTWYTGVERIVERIARAFDAVPDGARWHADLLLAAGLEVPSLRPAVFRGATVSGLKRYLAFRHRFRNLYLFDLDAGQMTPLSVELPSVWAAARGDLLQFADSLEQIAARMEAS